MDADLQNDPEDIPRLVGAIWMADVVVGWRRCRCDPLTKRIASRLANTLRNWLMGESIPDGGCSLKVFRRSALSHFPRFDGLHRFYPTLASMAGLRVEVIPVRHHPRRSGNSKYGISNRLLGPLADLLVVRWMKSRHMGTVECVEIADDL
jgi:glycosyltransferase involved in cell wall biosynthesis